MLDLHLICVKYSIYSSMKFLLQKNTLARNRIWISRTFCADNYEFLIIFIKFSKLFYERSHEMFIKENQHQL